jgi:N-acetylglutamate synthase-like GNAT family acetyltransferase
MNKEQEYNHYSNDEIASIVSGWTKKAGTMIPKEPEAIKKLLESGLTVMVWDKEGVPIGFAAVTFEWPGGWKELGGLVVNPDFRQQGVGHKVVAKQIEMAKAKFPDGKLFALCNKDSLKILSSLGAEVIEDPKLLPNEVWGACLECPNFQKAKVEGKLCCDTPVLIK